MDALCLRSSSSSVTVLECSWWEHGCGTVHMHVSNEKILIFLMKKPVLLCSKPLQVPSLSETSSVSRALLILASDSLRHLSHAQPVPKTLHSMHTLSAHHLWGWFSSGTAGQCTAPGMVLTCTSSGVRTSTSSTGPLFALPDIASMSSMDPICGLQ